MKISVKELAEIIGGEVIGDGSLLIEGLAGVEDAREGTAVFAENEKYLTLAAGSDASCVILPESLAKDCGKTLIAVKNMVLANAAALKRFDKPSRDPKAGIHPTAVIEEGAKLGENVAVGARCFIAADAVIGNNCVLYPGVYAGPRSVVGDDCVLHPNVVLYGDLTLGDRVVIHGGAVIGADGFGYGAGPEGPVKLPHIGTVEIGNDAEIGANSTVDRGKMGATVIGHHTKIDNLVHIAHNCKIGNYCLVAAQTGVAGSSVLEDGVTLADQVGIADHVRIGTGAVMAARSATVSDIEAKMVMLGYPPNPIREEQRIRAFVKRLPQTMERIRAMEKELAAIKEKESED
ncbi:MAG: UDP-3-O-(3-hydroxymyristoyl)glucosamine N-acyltransferase [Abditibacteriota bacterium]|nr:UDP-3-O-(3-hydroxymyristoyl)glucosamine N-acyltransferase [Abditibacteriota bacterium]